MSVPSDICLKPKQKGWRRTRNDLVVCVTGTKPAIELATKTYARTHVRSVTVRYKIDSWRWAPGWTQSETKRFSVTCAHSCLVRGQAAIEFFAKMRWRWPEPVCGGANLRRIFNRLWRF